MRDIGHVLSLGRHIAPTDQGVLDFPCQSVVKGKGDVCVESFALREAIEDGLKPVVIILDVSGLFQCTQPKGVKQKGNVIFLS